MDQRQAVFLKESESPDKNMNALTRRTHLHLLLLPLAVAASLAACGGGDDDGGQVDPPVAPTNLADCFNPSMYTAGSSWSVASTTTFLSSAPGATQRAPEATVEEMSVTAPPPDWGLGAGIVRMFPYLRAVNDSGYGGTYVRVANGVVQTLYRIDVGYLSNRPSTYRVLLPALEAPVSLAVGDSFARTASVCIYPRFTESVGGKLVLPPPTLESCPENPTIFTSHQWTFNGAASVTVPAGTFMTCDVSSVRDGVAYREWRVAHGAYKGLTVKQTQTYSDSVTTQEANSLSANWK